jgi:hypothetical protein
MKEIVEWMRFMELLQEDPRIGPKHISLMVAIMRLWLVQGFSDTVDVSARKLMPRAKIGGMGPYHRTIRQLHGYGYIRYEPSCNPEVPSRVYLEFGRINLKG